MRSTILACLMVGIMALPAAAHFGMVIPESNIATQQTRSTDIKLSFAHPFEQAGMPLVAPDKFFVFHNGSTTNLLPTLSSATAMNADGWKSHFTFTRPGVYQFVMEPVPYWEPEEDCFIVHYTKTYVAAFGSEEGWDVPVGLPTEIVPLTRPYGLYAGNSFSGQVLVNGKPAPNTVVEYELYNTAGYTAPTEHHYTLVTKTDPQGIFTVTLPVAGWWGFAALTTADYTLPAPADASGKPKEKAVELGAVLWIKLDAFSK